jgi:hypothetical protein
LLDQFAGRQDVAGDRLCEDGVAHAEGVVALLGLDDFAAESLFRRL